MSSLKVVVYAEGPADDYSVGTEPDRLLHPDEFGAVHVLVNRLLTERCGLGQVSLHTGLHLPRSRQPRGSDLVGPLLKKLLIWPPSLVKPDLAVVCVDQDGEKDRRRVLKGRVKRESSCPTVVAVPKPELEAWLMADIGALGAVLSVTEQPPKPETLKPGNAKLWLGNEIGRTHNRPDGTIKAEVRRNLALSTDLDVAIKRCRTLKLFADDLRDALAS